MSMTTSETERLRADAERQRQALGRDLEALGDHVSPGRMVERRRAAVRQSVTSVRDRVMGVAGSATDSVQGTVHGAAGSVGDAAGSMRETVAGAPDAARERVAGAPLIAGLVGAGLGFVVATAIPASRREKELGQRVQPAVEKAVGEAGELARTTVQEEIAPEAKAAVEDLTGTAKEAVEHVKEEASTAAQQTADDARSAAQEVKSEATP